MTLKELMEAADRRNEARYPVCSVWDPMDWAGAMAGEAGECVNKAKKLRFCGEWDDRIGQLRDDVVAEACDTIWYALILMKQLGVKDPELEMKRVFNEVSRRNGWPDSFPAHGE